MRDSFIDSKGVYVKGSELGYSLAKIEKILQLSFYQKQTPFRQGHEKNFFKKTTQNLPKGP